VKFLKLFVTADRFRGLRNRGRLDKDQKDKLDLDRLRARLGEKPRTKAGQIRQAWPDIKALFDAGHSLKDIWVWLNESGIQIGYARLSHYTGQLRRRDQSAASPERLRVSDHPPQSSHEGSSRQVATEVEKPPAPVDPLANIREREARRPGFQYNSEPDVKKLI
jgi:hypothetical protein